MRRLGGKDLSSKQIRDEFIKIHFDDEVYRNLRIDQHTSFTYGLKRCYLAGTITRRLTYTNSNGSYNYTGAKQFVYSLT